MLSLSKKTDYALTALSHLARHDGVTASAREIAAAHSLPPALLMNILKELQQQGFVRSTRGVHGGYQLAIDLADFSLHDLIVAMDGPVRLVACADDAVPCVHADESESLACQVSGHCAVQAPLQALHQRLVQFLDEVKLGDVLLK